MRMWFTGRCQRPLESNWTDKLVVWLQKHFTVCLKSLVWSSPDAVLCLAPLIISFWKKLSENGFPRDALNVFQLVMVIWTTGSSCSRCEISVQGMDVSSSTSTISFGRSVLLWVVLPLNAALAHLFYNAWPQDWILTGFLESVIPQSPSPFGFFL